MNQKYLYIGIISVIALLLVGGGIWFFISISSSGTEANNSGGVFGTATDNINNASNNGSQAPSQTNTSTSGQVSQNKIFQISAGPVVGATLIQILHPTTTLARYILQENGHVFDLPLDVAGAVPRVVSNVTIPGGQRAIWLEQGNATIMQYTEGSVVKSVYLGFPVATTTNTAITLPTRIVFLPDSIVDIAASPDGNSVTYLLKTSSGVDGYIAKSDGTNSKKIYSLPLSQVLISWPSQSTLLAQSKSAAGVPGILFSIDTKSGTATPIVYADGITAKADSNFSHIMYQSVPNGAAVRITYLRDVKKGTNQALSFSPLPEKCLWNSVSTSTAYCAAPLSYIPSNYLDLWHQGAASVADALFLFDASTGKSSILTAPGGADGGVQSDIFEMALSPNEKYLSFTTKGGRSLWGVRLTP